MKGIRCYTCIGNKEGWMRGNSHSTERSKAECFIESSQELTARKTYFITIRHISLSVPSYKKHVLLKIKSWFE